LPRFLNNILEIDGNKYPQTLVDSVQPTIKASRTVAIKNIGFSRSANDAVIVFNVNKSGFIKSISTIASADFSSAPPNKYVTYYIDINGVTVFEASYAHLQSSGIISRLNAFGTYQVWFPELPDIEVKANDEVIVTINYDNTLTNWRNGVSHLWVETVE